MKCMKKNKKEKIPLKRQVALACFMEAVPSIIDMWQSSESYPHTTFDRWLMDIYEEHKNKGKEKK